MTAPVLGPTSDSLRRAAELLREGGVVVAIETNLALILDPLNGETVEPAYETRGRPARKPLSVFVRDPADWHRYATHEHPNPVGTLVDVALAREQVVDVALAREQGFDGVDAIVARSARGTTYASTVVDVTDATTAAGASEVEILSHEGLTCDDIEAVLD